MIIVTLNRTEFEYDIYSLTKAFFPMEDVELYYTKEAQAEGKNVACTNHSIEERAASGSQDQDVKPESPAAGHFAIQYEDNRITIAWEDAPEGPAHSTFAVDFSDRTATKNA